MKSILIQIILSKARMGREEPAKQQSWPVSVQKRPKGSQKPAKWQGWPVSVENSPHGSRKAGWATKLACLSREKPAGVAKSRLSDKAGLSQSRTARMRREKTGQETRLARLLREKPAPFEKSRLSEKDGPF